LKERFFLLIYLIFVAFVSSTANVTALTLASTLTVALFLLTQTEFPLKLAIPTATINSVVSISYFLSKKPDCALFITTFNLRVFTIMFLTLLFSRRVNLFRALSFSPTLSILLTVTYSQITIFRSTFINFREAFRSRLMEKPEKKDAYRFISSSTYYFLNTAFRNSEEIAQAMKSRGFFSD